MHSPSRGRITAARDAIWVVIDLIDDIRADSERIDATALLLRLRGDLLSMLRVLDRAEILLAVDPSPAA